MEMKNNGGLVDSSDENGRNGGRLRCEDRDGMKKIETKTIYQYTSLEVLALVLSEKKIRFTNLCKLDDPLEKYVKIINFDSKDRKLTHIRHNYGKYCFVSCWTCSKKESIPMWDMYGNRKKGVRIGLPYEMFDKDYDINKKRNSSKALFNIRDEYKVYPEFYLVDYNRLDDPELITSDWKIEIGNLGKYKIKDWSFQDECRFRLFCYKERNNSDKLLWFIPHDNVDYDIVDNKPSNEPFVDYPLDKNVLNEIEIVIGSNMPKGDRVLLQALLEKHGIKKDRVCESDFYVKE